MENSCTAPNINRVGFQLFPPLSHVTELVVWSKFVELICELFSSSIKVSDSRILIKVNGEQVFLPKDGFYFRELSFSRSPVSEKLVSDMKKIAAGYFSSRIFDASCSKYSEGELKESYERFISDATRSETGSSAVESLDSHVCAYCLQNVSALDVIMCRYCMRRSYCSSRCMELDFDPHGEGQGHSMWCSLGVCEEGIDWAVQPVQGKGLGVVAKKLIPTRSRIMVDRPKHIGFPAVRDLEPTGGLLYEKERLNSFMVDTESLLCLRVARINHACIPNSAQVFDADMGVMIVVANRDIQPGEEISIAT